MRKLGHYILLSTKKYILLSRKENRLAKVREVLFDLMRRFGMTQIFGNVGSTEELMLKNFPPDFDYILSLHESVAVAMADAYSQDTGKPVHVNLHTEREVVTVWAISKLPGTTGRR